MNVEVVDPRDLRWEDHHPRYRVDVWNPDYRGCITYEITDAPVDDVLRWARNNTPPGGHHLVMVVSEHGPNTKGVIVIDGDADPPHTTVGDMALFRAE